MSSRTLSPPPKRSAKPVSALNLTSIKAKPAPSGAEHADCDHAHDDDHAHEHASGGACGHEHSHEGVLHVHGLGSGNGDPRKALIWALILNGGFLVIELVVGLMVDSLALLSDAVHMLSDVAALALALGAAQLARRPPSDRMTFGLIRAEVLGAFLNAVLMVGACIFIVYEAIERAMAGPPDVPGAPVLIIGTIGLAINLLSAWALWRSHRDNLNIRGALVHMLGDALGSVGAIIAALFLFADLPMADPVVSLLTVVLVLWATWSLLRDSSRVLLQLPPAGVSVAALRETLLTIPEVNEVHDLHLWTLDGQKSVVTAHLVVPDALLRPSLAREAGSLLAKQHKVGHATLQLEPLSERSKCEAVDCGAVQEKTDGATT